jgi:casein kinase II subunit beta
MRTSTNAAQPKITSDFPLSKDNESCPTWISRFLDRKENRFLLRIPDAYLEDDFNLNELSSIVPNFSCALSLILEENLQEEEEQDSGNRDDYDSEENQIDHTAEEIHRSAKLLYYLAHQRFLLTRIGMQEMAERYANGEYGVCPRTCCEGTKVIPTGISDLPGKHAFKLYCPQCADVYYPEDPKFQFVDGCAWGTSFAQVFFTTFSPLLSPNTAVAAAAAASKCDNSNLSINELEDLSEIAAVEAVRIAAGEEAEMLIYTPKIFGFKIHSISSAATRRADLRVKQNMFTCYTKLEIPK